LFVALLALPLASQAQQSLITRTVNVLDAVCNGGPSNATLTTLSCTISNNSGGLSNAEEQEAALQVAGNEAAAAGSNATQTTMAQMETQTERLAVVRNDHVSAPLETDRLGAFLNVFGGWGDVGAQGEESSFDYHGGGFTGGVDYRIDDNKVAGLGFGWNRQVDDFDLFTSVAGGGAVVGGGDLEADSYVLSLYGTLHQGPVYVDGMLSYTYVDYEIRRPVVIPGLGFGAVAQADPNAHQLGLSTGVGYPILLSGVLADATVGPIARVEYLYTRISSYTEGGVPGVALDYDDQNVHSLVTSIGGEVSYPVSTSVGVFTPQLRVTWEHEFEDDKRSIDSRLVADDTGRGFLSVFTDSPDRNYARVGASVAAQLAGGISAFVDYDAVVALRKIDAHKITAGGRIEF